MTTYIFILLTAIILLLLAENIGLSGEISSVRAERDLIDAQLYRCRNELVAALLERR